MESLLSGLFMAFVVIIGALVGTGLYLLICRPLFRHGSTPGVRALRSVLLQLLLSPAFAGGHGLAVLPFGYLFAMSFSGRDNGIINQLNVPIYLLAVVLSFVFESKLARKARATDQEFEARSAAAHARPKAMVPDAISPQEALARISSDYSPRLMLAFTLGMLGTLVVWLGMLLLAYIPAFRQVFYGGASGPWLQWLALSMTNAPILVCFAAAYLFLRLHPAACGIVPGKTARIWLGIACLLGVISYAVPGFGGFARYPAMIASAIGWLLIVRERSTPDSLASS